MARNITVRDSEEWAETIITYHEANGFPFDRSQQSLSRYLAALAASLTGNAYTIYNRSIPALIIHLAAYYSGLPLTTKNTDFNDALERLNSALVISTGNAAAFADGQTAPAGFHWDFITDDFTGERVTDDYSSQPVVDLVTN